MKLSERLLDEAEGYGPGPTTLQADDVRQLATLLREAAALAKRYEEAPVGNCVACDFEGYERPTWHVIDDRDAVPLTLRGRVRIIREPARRDG